MRGLMTFGTMAVALTAGVAAAGEHPIEINNHYFQNEDKYPTRDGYYFTQDNEGRFEAIQGPFENGPARCIGSGFVHEGRNPEIGGICIFGEGEDTFTMSWKVNYPKMRNDWQIVGGTGRYEGMTGEGVATTDIEVVYHAMPLRQTHIIGTVDLPGE